MNIIYPIIIVLIAYCVMGDGKMLKSLKSEHIVLITLGIWLFTITMNKDGFKALEVQEGEVLWWRNPSVPYKTLNKSQSAPLDFWDYWTVSGNINTQGDIKDGMCYNTTTKEVRELPSWGGIIPLDGNDENCGGEDWIWQPAQGACKGDGQKIKESILDYIETQGSGIGFAPDARPAAELALNEFFNSRSGGWLSESEAARVAANLKPHIAFASDEIGATRDLSLKAWAREAAGDAVTQLTIDYGTESAALVGLDGTALEEQESVVAGMEGQIVAKVLEIHLKSEFVSGCEKNEESEASVYSCKIVSETQCKDSAGAGTWEPNTTIDRNTGNILQAGSASETLHENEQGESENWKMIKSILSGIIVLITFIFTCNNAYWIGVLTKLGWKRLPALLFRFIMIFFHISLGFGLVLLINGNLKWKQWTYQQATETILALDEEGAPSTDKEVLTSEDIKESGGTEIYHFYAPVFEHRDDYKDVADTHKWAQGELEGKTKLYEFTHDNCPAYLNPPGSSKITCILPYNYPPTTKWVADGWFPDVTDSAVQKYLGWGGVSTLITTFITLSVIESIFAEKTTRRVRWKWQAVKFGISLVAAMTIVGMLCKGSFPRISVGGEGIKGLISPLSILIFFVFMFSIMMSWMGGAQNNKLQKLVGKGRGVESASARRGEDVVAELATALGATDAALAAAPAGQRLQGQGAMDDEGRWVQELMGDFTPPGWWWTIKRIIILIIVCVFISGGATVKYWPDYHGKLDANVEVQSQDLRELTCEGDNDIVKCVNLDTGELCTQSEPRRDESDHLSCEEGCVRQQGCLYVAPPGTSDASTKNSIDITDYYKGSFCIDAYPLADHHDIAQSLCNQQHTSDDCNKVSVGKCVPNQRHALGSEISDICGYMNNNEQQCEGYGMRCVPIEGEEETTGKYGYGEGQVAGVKCRDYWDAQGICGQIVDVNTDDPICEWKQAADVALCEYHEPKLEAQDAAQEGDETNNNLRRCKFIGSEDVNENWNDERYWRNEMLHSLPTLTNEEYRGLYGSLNIPIPQTVDAETYESYMEEDKADIAREAITSIFRNAHPGEAPEGTEHENVCLSGEWFCPNTFEDLNNQDAVRSMSEASCEDRTLMTNSEQNLLFSTQLMSAKPTLDATLQSILQTSAYCAATDTEGAHVDACAEAIEQAASDAAALPRSTQSQQEARAAAMAAQDTPEGRRNACMAIGDADPVCTYHSGEATATDGAGVIGLLDQLIGSTQDVTGLINGLPCCPSDINANIDENLQSSLTITNTSGDTTGAKLLYKHGDNRTPCVKWEEGNYDGACHLPGDPGKPVGVGVVTAENNNGRCNDDQLPLQGGSVTTPTGSDRGDGSGPPDQGWQRYSGREGNCVNSCQEDCPSYPFNPEPGVSRHLRQCRGVRDRVTHHSPRLYACEGNIVTENDANCGADESNRGPDVYWATDYATAQLVEEQGQPHSKENICCTGGGAA